MLGYRTVKEERLLATVQFVNSSGRGQNDRSVYNRQVGDCDIRGASSPVFCSNDLGASSIPGTKVMKRLKAEEIAELIVDGSLLLIVVIIVIVWRML